MQPLFPARAGVILFCDFVDRKWEPIPRTRGGDPLGVAINDDSDPYSPHARG